MCHRQILPLLKFRRHGYKDTNDNDIYIDGEGRKVGDRDTRKEGDKCKDKCGDKRKNKYRDRVRDKRPRHRKQLSDSDTIDHSLQIEKFEL